MGYDAPELSERQRDILQAILEDYIATAEPVGSRTLTKRNPGIDLSPATVRNAMADLEELGLLSAPHASAGRIPTAMAFRVYVERLAQRGRISPRERELISAITGNEPDHDITRILRDAGRALSSVSKHAAMVLVPSFEDVVFEHIQFVPVRDQAVLVVFVAKSGLIQQQVVDTPIRLDRDELLHMSNYLNSQLGGRPLSEVRLEILRAMQDERAQADQLMKNALVLAERAFGGPSFGSSLVVEGERTFLDQPEFADVAKLRQLLRAFEEKTMLLRLLEAASVQAIGAAAAASQETRVLLGSEGNVKELKDIAVVSTSYSVADGPGGRVAVIGPTRMDYSRVVPMVELTAQALSQSLGPGERRPVEPPKDEQEP